MINELSTSQKLDWSNYDMWKWKIQYLLNEMDILEHLTVAKFPPSDTDKEASPLILLLCNINKAYWLTKTGPIRIEGHDLLCSISCMTTLLENLSYVP